MNNSAFEIVRGDDMSIEIEILDDEGVAVDLTNAEVFFTAKKSVNAPDSEAVLSKSVGNGSDEGIVQINFTASETNNLKPRSYWWDIQIVDDGIVTSSRRQLFRVVGDITRTITEIS